MSLERKIKMKIEIYGKLVEGEILPINANGIKEIN